MADSYAKRRRRYATRQTNATLHVKPWGHLVIPIVMLLATLTLLYEFGSAESFGDALIEKTSLFLILIIYPAVWFYNFVTAPSRMDAEKDALIKDLAQQVEKAAAVLTAEYKPSPPYRYVRSGHEVYYRVGIRNSGAAEARGVKVWLRKAAPLPRTYIRDDFPYRAPAVTDTWKIDDTINVTDVAIAPYDEELFQVAATWAAPDEGQGTTRVVAYLDTKPHGNFFHWLMHSDEKWCLYYEATAFNAVEVKWRFIASPDNEIASITYLEGWG